MLCCVWIQNCVQGLNQCYRERKNTQQSSVMGWPPHSLDCNTALISIDFQACQNYANSVFASYTLFLRTFALFLQFTLHQVHCKNNCTITFLLPAVFRNLTVVLVTLYAIFKKASDASSFAVQHQLLMLHSCRPGIPIIQYAIIVDFYTFTICLSLTFQYHNSVL